jgi:tetratricopeptide (TPR) repeat protein
VALCAYRIRLHDPELEPQTLFDQAAAAGLVESRYFLGELSLRNGHLETAERLFQDLSDIEHWPGPWLGLAAIRMEFEEYVTALADLRRCLSSAPKQPEALSREAKVLTAIGQYRAALDELSRLEATHEWSQIDVDLWRAKDLRLLQRFPKANETAAAARVLSGAYVGADLAKESGLVFLGLQEPSDAATWLAHAVSLNEGDCEAWEHLGLAYDAMTSSAKAAEAFGRASTCSAAAAERLRHRATSSDDSDLTQGRLMALRARLRDRAQLYDVLRFRAALEAGRLFAALGKDDEAVAWLKVAAQSRELRDAALGLLKRIGYENLSDQRSPSNEPRP